MAVIAGVRFPLGYTHAMDQMSSSLCIVRAKLIAALPTLRAIYLFGSRARGDARVDSDYDLAVLCGEPLQPQRSFDLSLELSLLLDGDVDLADLLRASTVLKKEVIAHGRRLYERDVGEALDFEARSLTEYGHYRDMVAPQRMAVLQSGHAYRI